MNHPDLKIYPKAKVISPIKPIKNKISGDIGDFSFIACKKLFLGEGVHIADHVTIIGKGEVKINDFATIAPGVRIWTSEPSYGHKGGMNKYHEKHEPKTGNIEIGSKSFLGANSCVKEGIKIGEGAVVGACSYVNKDLDSWCVYVGSPAKKIKKR